MFIYIYIYLYIYIYIYTYVYIHLFMCIYILLDLCIVGRCVVAPRRLKEVSVGTSVEDFGFSICSIWIGTCVGDSS